MSDGNRYGQYCPITRAVEVLGERWSVLILRDMLVGATRFNDIARGNPRLSRTLLSKRLRQLEQAGVIEHVDDEYLLTPAGEDLRSVVFSLGEWGAKWQFDDPRHSELDPELLMWWVHGRLDYSHLPDRRLVFEFRFSDQPRWFWILKDAQGPSICTHDPGFGVDATVKTDLSTMYRIWLGKQTLRQAVENGHLELDGTPAIVRRLPATLRLSPIADIVAAAETP
ncbi:winged helix-turn-helix transcriptional regulator [Ilumatobacter sp.]|uniref:winged helix-turn-helix transcriptional regulator n=1 Tax=Ilumatobacter sp. TaxID=1967498 RepID=UPI003B51E705